MRYIIIFFACIAFAIASIVLWLAAIVPHGEGAFGIAKAIPFILVFGSIIVFSIVWFPANLCVFLWNRRTHDRQNSGGSKVIVAFSACVFLICISKLGMNARHHSKPGPPAPSRPLQLKDIKGLIDDFCKRERNGEKLTPADGIFGTMEQIMYSANPEIINYTADNLPDDSGFLWVIAASPNCPTNLFPRFLAIPSTQRPLARNPKATPETLETLSHSKNADIRACVGANTNTPRATLERLAIDTDKGVRDSASRNIKAHSRN